jgi:hypothetical protein
VTRTRRATLRLSGETLDSLTPVPERSPRPADGWDTPDGWDDLAVWEGIGPGQPSVPGWLVRRDPEPRAWATGLLVPDLLVRPASGDGRAGVLVCLVRTALQASRLAALLPLARGGEPILCAGPGPLLEPLRERGVWTVELDSPALAPLVAVAASRSETHAPLQTERPAPRRRRVA